MQTNKIVYFKLQLKIDINYINMIFQLIKCLIISILPENSEFEMRETQISLDYCFERKADSSKNESGGSKIEHTDF